MTNPVSASMTTGSGKYNTIKELNPEELNPEELNPMLQSPPSFHLP